MFKIKKWNRRLGSYMNGNTEVSIYADGTKVRKTKDDEFRPAFAENMDVKICNRCDMGCPMCFENSTKDGDIADIMNAKWVDTLHPYQELSLGGGNVLEHPDLVPFLEKLKSKKIIVNFTVNQAHFERERAFIDKLIKDKLVYGIGISLNNPTDSFIEQAKEYPNAVIHVINGIVSKEEMCKLYDKGLKILILGYKMLGRGHDYYMEHTIDVIRNQRWLKGHLPEVMEKFEVVSFDNLAIKQLGVKALLPKPVWDTFYMGDDGTITYYIDMVNNKFSKTSTTPYSKRHDVLDSVDDMFSVITHEKTLDKSGAV